MSSSKSSKSADAIEAVRDGRCHLAVSFAYNLAPRLDIAGLASHRLLDEPVFLALPKPWRRERKPIALERLAQEDWIVGSRQPDDRQLAERACAVAGFAPGITHTVDDYDLVLRMVSAELGVGFVPELGLRFPQRRDCGGLHTLRRAAPPARRCHDAERPRRLTNGSGLALGVGQNKLSAVPAVTRTPAGGKPPASRPSSS